MFFCDCAQIFKHYVLVCGYETLCCWLFPSLFQITFFVGKGVVPFGESRPATKFLGQARLPATASAKGFISAF
ncbi:hypothetical protein DRJ25_01275 [Candidatus Woesearchaeota archaeon]|nr:MAG: hypothetical protein DRJ25_01275 [Candidatus Woesearchaeota archaeon]